MINAYAAALKQAELSSAAHAPVVTACNEEHSANVQWAAPVVQRNYSTPAIGQYETEQNVEARSINLLRLNRLRDISSGGGAEETLIFSTTDGKTMLLLTVPHGQYVRIDGYVSC